MIVGGDGGQEKIRFYRRIPVDEAGNLSPARVDDALVTRIRATFFRGPKDLT